MQGSCAIKYQKNLRSSDIYLYKNQLTSRNDQKEIPLHKLKTNIFNNYVPKSRWLVEDNYRTAKRRGKYLLLTTETEAKSHKNMI